jgi:lipid-A-disaccharide synthase
MRGGGRAVGDLAPTDAAETIVRETRISGHGHDVSVFMVAGEHSGDALGAKLMASLNQLRRGRIRYLGVGGPGMERQGLVSQFPLDDVAVMGPAAIAARLPLILSRMRSTAKAAMAAEPNVVVIIDSPEFTHPIARGIRRRRPSIPIVDYVSPTVWAWRPGRARKMRNYVDHVLALWPFEPDAHERLGGPPCSFVGHPLIERHQWIAALDPKPLAERLGLAGNKPVLVILPGSRTSEVSRLMPSFGDAVTRLTEHGRDFEVIIPVVAKLRGLIERKLRDWPIEPHLVEDEEDKFRAFKLATVALAASGTVTLELALAGTPMVVAYKVDAIIAPVLRRLIKAPSTVLPNLVLGQKVFPEFHQEDCTGGKLANALAPLLEDGPERARQLAALARIPAALQVEGYAPSEAAARIVLDYADNGRGWPRRGLGRD